MTIYREFCRYRDLLAEDVDNLSPVTMATIAGFGKLGDFDPFYLEIRTDVLQCVELFGALSPQLDLSAALRTMDRAPRGRNLTEDALYEEQRKLSDSLARMRAEAEQMGEFRFCELWRHVPPRLRSDFINRLGEAGLGQTADAPYESLESARQQPIQTMLAPSKRGEPIYLSSFIESDLTRQLIPTMRKLGMRPIAMKEPLRRDEPLGFLRKRIAACRGGILRLSHDWSDAQEMEIREGLKHFPNRLLIISEPDMLDRTPPSLSPHSLLPVNGPTMSAQEAQQFASILSQSWQSNSG